MPKGQQKLVTSTSMLITVPVGVDAKVAAANITHGPLNLTATVIHSGAYNPGDPIPVSVQALVTAPSMPTRLLAERPGDGMIGQTDGTAMSSMSLSLQLR